VALKRHPISYKREFDGRAKKITEMYLANGNNIQRFVAHN
jgi:hypothetical protein